jgi:hypothetical protein
MAGGITYGGDYVTASGKTPQETIEFVCTDPKFLEKAAAKKPNAVVRFLKGAYSHPRDWWVGIIWCFMSLGTFGGDAKRRADEWGRDLETLIQFARKNPKLAYRLISVYLKNQVQNSPEFYGRLAGGMFTNYASRGGRLGSRLGTGMKVASMTANFILATTGAMILSVKYGGKDIISIFDAAINGDYLPDLSSQQYKEIFRSVMESEIPVDDADIEIMVQILEGVLDCLNNPGKYVGGADKGTIQPHVPVGQVSSARPNGVFGSIPRGSETNALDVISERGRPQP